MTTPTITDLQTNQQLHAGQWISVEDRMPDDEAVVLVYDPSQSEPVWLSYFDAEELAWRYVDCGLSRPTHWMELPEPPKES